MDACTEDGSFELIDLAGVSLPDLMRQDGSAFIHCLRRLVMDNDNPDTQTVVAFQSHSE